MNQAKKTSVTWKQYVGNLIKDFRGLWIKSFQGSLEAKAGPVDIDGELNYRDKLQFYT